MQKTDWNKPNSKITDHFRVYEALTMGKQFKPLSEISPNGFSYDEIAENVTKTAIKMEAIRTILGDKPIVVTSWYRTFGHNHSIKGAKKSMHLCGLAVDFYVIGFGGGEGCDYVRSVLVKKLEELDIRMENLQGSNWVHIDLKKFNRFFKP